MISMTEVQLKKRHQMQQILQNYAAVMAWMASWY